MSAQPVEVTRPLMRYHGGKFQLALWIIEHLPTHRTYVEPFAGAANVLLRKPRSYAEVLNDLDGEIVNLYRVLRDPAQARELVRLVQLTPYARAEFETSWLTDGDPVEQARRTLFRAAAGHGSSAATGKWRTGFRCNVQRSGTHPATDWASTPAALEAIIARLAGVVIECEPALRVIDRYDAPSACFYVDPPYVLDTRHERWAGRAYRHEMNDADHRELAAALHRVKGAVVLSGYPSALYDELYADWQCVTHDGRSDRAAPRTECLWLNGAADAGGRQPRLLEVIDHAR